MGIDQNFYIGPFAKCRDAGIPKTKKIRFCPGDSSHRALGEFCSSCGSKIADQLQTFPGESAQSVSSWDVAEECDERITPISGMCEFGEKLHSYWTSNRNNDGIESTSLEMYDTTIREIAPDAIEEGKAKFAEVLAPEIEILKKHYASVEICWGILGWCS